MFHWKNSLFAVCLLIAFVAGMSIRRHVLLSQYHVHGRALPFTLESALHYRMVRMLHDNHRIPQVDTMIQYPEGVRPSQTYTLGSEYAYAAMAELLPDRIPFAERVRWASVIWFCLGIPLMGLWVRWATGSNASGVIAALFYAVVISSVIRSTGQELSRENFALPLLLAHLAFDARAKYSVRGGKWIPIILSAVFLACAAMAWDMIQFYVFLWAVCGGIWTCAGMLTLRSNHGLRWLFQWGLLLVASIINPYMRVHGWAISIPMLISYAVVACMVWQYRKPMNHAGRMLVFIGCAAVILTLGLALGSTYSDAYGHFFDLLMAKIRFLNKKPADPSLLTFYQRIMWVPALNSATWVLTLTLFPVMLLLSLGFAIGLLFRRDHPRIEICQLLIFYGSSLIAFVFFVRFHVFLAMFSAAMLGYGFSYLSERRRWISWVLIFSLMTGWFVEVSHTLRDAHKWGRQGVYYQEIEELANWLLDNVATNAVVANFGVSSFILTYGNCPIVLHPKFESSETRERVRTYGEMLFKGDEVVFRDWMDQYGARYYVHSLGEFSQRAPNRQMRYFVDALQPDTEVPAWLFEHQPFKCRYFKYLWGNRKYRVFRALTGDEQAASRHMGRRARQKLEKMDLDGAEDIAAKALLIDPGNQAAQKVLKHVGTLRDQGITYRLEGDSDVP